ncbi:hypothetical protein PoB_005324600 [Plakobranchus ocellatus]|uniref:Uncharacterized protein n=1 Tax=Plakobranchus ocellatus TaxID=259542 RepID=A0AAV4BU68_9GAST|nr:hypothetical protein PoB_005324600 [Plakobranchus ocellatus]
MLDRSRKGEGDQNVTRPTDRDGGNSFVRPQIRRLTIGTRAMPCNRRPGPSSACSGYGSAGNLESAELAHVDAKTLRQNAANPRSHIYVIGLRDFRERSYFWITTTVHLWAYTCCTDHDDITAVSVWRASEQRNKRQYFLLYIWQFSEKKSRERTK